MPPIGPLLWYLCAVGAVAVNPYMATMLVDAGVPRGQTPLWLIVLPAGNLLIAPLWAWLADRFGYASHWHRASILAASGALLLLAFAPSAWVVVGLVGYAAARPGVFPPADASTAHALKERWGMLRGLGSIGFLVAAAGVGWGKDQWAVLPAVVAAVLLVAAAALSSTLPPLPVVDRSVVGSPWALLRERRIALLMAVCCANGMSLASYDLIFALHMEDLDAPSAATGIALGWGVAVEVVVMVLAQRALQRVRASTLLLLSVASAVVRYGGMALSADVRLQVVLQGFHGFQFGLFWAVCVHLLASWTAIDRRRSAQSLLYAVTFGIAPVTGLLLTSGWLATGGTLRSWFGLLAVPSLLASLLAWRLGRFDPVD